ncbi:MAG: CAP domain-containing protein [Lachnospiraceae bacterium]|nr:CAP domain-containing protein [Lachnospiraceae bacterium]
MEPKNNEANVCPFCGTSQEVTAGAGSNGAQGVSVSNAEASIPQNASNTAASLSQSGSAAASSTSSASSAAAAAGTAARGTAGKVMLSLQAKVLAGVIAAAAVAGVGYIAVQQFSRPQVDSQEELSEEPSEENTETAEEAATEFSEEEVYQYDQEDTQAAEFTEDPSDTEEELSDEDPTDSEQEEALAEPAQEDTASWSVDDTVTGTMFAMSGINVRSGPSTAYEAIGTLSSAEEVEVTGRADTGWYRILFHGGDGYVSGQYLTAEKPAAPEAETTASAGNETNQSAEETVTETTAEEQTAAESTETTQTAAETTQTTAGTQQTETTSSGSYQSQVVSLTNAQRTANGVAQLTENSLLMSAAQARAAELASIDSIYVNGQHHTRLDGRSWATAMDDAGYSYTSAAENLAQGQTTPEQAVNEWMNSQGHKTNILNSAYTETGVGYAVSASGTVYWVQLFATP